jgi:hypothetical protein
MYRPQLRALPVYQTINVTRDFHICKIKNISTVTWRSAAKIKETIKDAKITVNNNVP